MKNKSTKKALLILSCLSMTFMYNPSDSFTNELFHENCLDTLSTKHEKISLPKNGLVVGNEEQVDISKTFVQYGLASNGRYCMRFATAVKGDVTKVEYTRKVREDSKVLEVNSLYRGISSEGKTVFYNGSGLTDNVEEAGKYYWACYTVEFTEESTYKNDNFEAFVTVTYSENEQEKTLNSIAKTASLNQLIANNAPKFTLTRDGETVTDTAYKALEDNPDKLKLPVVSAEDVNGKVVATEVKYKFNGVESVDPGYSTEAWTKDQYSVGTHTWTFVAKDLLNNSTSEETITLDVYKRILAEGRGGSYQMTVDKELSDNPEIYATNNGMEARAFNLEPSKYYYAEATFTKPTKAGIGAGFIHSYPNTNNGGFIREQIRTGNLSTVDMVKGPNFEGASDYYTMWNAYFNKRQDLCGNPNYDIDSYLRDETTKLAIARNGNTYYFWMNDILLEKYVSSDFVNQDTVPGIILQGWETGINGTRAKNINFCNGEDAVNKISSLEGSFAPFGYYRNDSDKYNSGSYSNNVLTYTTAEGQQYYNSIVGSNILLKGNSHISFRYTATSYNAGGDDYSIFYLSKINEVFAKDPNAKTSKIASWAMIHYNSFNTTLNATASQIESPWSYDKKFAGDGSTYHWDMKTWDIDIKVRIETGGTTKVTYKFTEVNGNNSASYEETLTSGIKMSGTGMNTSWYGLFFQGHNKNSYTISNLVMEPLAD